MNPAPKTCDVLRPNHNQTSAVKRALTFLETVSLLSNSASNQKQSILSIHQHN